MCSKTLQGGSHNYGHYSQNSSFSGSFSIAEVNGPDIKSENNFGKVLFKQIDKPSIKVNGNLFTYSFPPNSFTMIKGKFGK